MNARIGSLGCLYLALGATGCSVIAPVDDVVPTAVTRPAASAASAAPMPGASSKSATAGTPASVPSPPVGVVSDQPTISFSPMYSAYDGVHSFKIPAALTDMHPQAMWSVVPPDAATLEADARTGGVLITTRRAGDFKVVATAGAARGAADLHVTAATPELWAMGEARYKNNVRIDFAPTQTGDAGMPMAPSMVEFPDSAACTNCHGQGAPRLGIEHTPQQIGGYSDQDLSTIIATGIKPPGAPFRSTIPAFFFRMFHTWSTASEAEQQGLVIYLRSLEPKEQQEIRYGSPSSP